MEREWTALFVDILGFASLVENSPIPLEYIDTGAVQLDMNGLRKVHVIESLRRHFGHASFRAGQEELAFTPNFGSISSAQDSRQLQFAARFVF